eukprot:4635846-Pleurochrysis_carterae.AAC.1
MPSPTPVSFPSFSGRKSSVGFFQHPRSSALHGQVHARELEFTQRGAEAILHQNTITDVWRLGHRAT